MNDLQWVDSTWGTLTVQEKREYLTELEHYCNNQPNEVQLAIEPKEYFCEGVYAREITMPKGAIVVGEIHKYPQINTISKGIIRVATEEGVKTIEAPCTFISPAGTKRAGFVLEDTVWTTYHATELTDGEAIRKEIIAPDYTSLERQLEKT